MAKPHCINFKVLILNEADGTYFIPTLEKQFILAYRCVLCVVNYLTM